MKILLVAGGELDIEVLKKVYNELDSPYVIGVDRGTLILLENGIKIDRAIGDFDSVTDEEREGILSKLDFEKLNPVKDDTDTEHALKYAISLAPEEIIMLGCTGRRMDHSLACVGMLRLAYDAGIEAYIIDRYNRIRVVRGDVQLSASECYGKYISILPYGDKARGLSIKGFKYNAEGLDITAAETRGVSNEMIEEVGSISCDDYMIIMETRD